MPLKACNWNCVYCQLGRSTPVVGERKQYAPPEDMLAEVREAIRAHGREAIDWVTIVGSGEPLLHTGIGRLVAGVKSVTDVPLALLTNGSFLHLPEVREAVLPVDAVMPSIDAGSAEMFRKVDRPHPGISFDQHIEGLVAFRREYTGKFWPEVMLVKGVNDTEEALADIAEVLARLEPEVVHVNVPTRPPAEAWVEPPDNEGLMRAVAILGRSARIVVPAELDFDAARFDSIDDAIVEIVSRHPMREEEIRRMLRRWPADEVDRALKEVETSGRVQIVERFGARFLAAEGSRYSPGERKGGG